MNVKTNQKTAERDNNLCSRKAGLKKKLLFFLFYTLATKKRKKTNNNKNKNKIKNTNSAYQKKGKIFKQK